MLMIIEGDVDYVIYEICDLCDFLFLILNEFGIFISFFFFYKKDFILI